jgi:hypothetical protein
MSSIDPLTINAYLETDYAVFGQLPFVMRLGIFSEPLLKLYEEHNVNGAAFITACNPFSQKMSDVLNALKQAELRDDLNRRSFCFLDALGKHPSGNWPGEPGFLVLGLLFEEAEKLGKKYNQNAIVWCGIDVIPELILLR